jgi:hypothetical protein
MDTKDTSSCRTANARFLPVPALGGILTNHRDDPAYSFEREEEQRTGKEILQAG